MDTAPNRRPNALDLVIAAFLILCVLVIVCPTPDWASSLRPTAAEVVAASSLNRKAHWRAEQYIGDGERVARVDAVGYELIGGTPWVRLTLPDGSTALMSGAVIISELKDVAP